MEINQILKRGISIWGERKLTLSEIIVRLGKVFGDICRWERNYKKDAPTHTEDELKKELGNVIFSTIKWCDDLGFDPNECIEIAIKCQESGKESLS